MGQNTSGYVNLSYVSNTVLMDRDDWTTHQKKKIFQYAVIGFTQLSLYAINNVKVAYLKLSAINTVDLPDDYIDVSKIGMEFGGQIVTLTRRDNMPLPRETDDCGNELGVPSALAQEPDGSIYGYNGYYFATHWRNGQYVGELYGTEGGRNFGYYRIDLERRQIVFNHEIGQITKPIILEYLSSGVEACGETVVPRQCVEALRTWIHGQLARYDKSVAQSEKARLQQEHIVAFEQLKFFENMFSLDEYLDATRANARNVPRR